MVKDMKGKDNGKGKSAALLEVFCWVLIGVFPPPIVVYVLWLICVDFLDISDEGPYIVSLVIAALSDIVLTIAWFDNFAQSIIRGILGREDEAGIDEENITEDNTPSEHPKVFQSKPVNEYKFADIITIQDYYEKTKQELSLKKSINSKKIEDLHSKRQKYYIYWLIAIIGLYAVLFGVTFYGIKSRASDTLMAGILGIISTTIGILLNKKPYIYEELQHFRKKDEELTRAITDCDKEITTAQYRLIIFVEISNAFGVICNGLFGKTIPNPSDAASNTDSQDACEEEE